MLPPLEEPASVCLSRAEFETNLFGLLLMRVAQRYVLPQGALERLGLPNNESYVETLLRQYDGDQDGCVNYQDFASYVQKNEARIWQAFRCILPMFAHEPAIQFDVQR